MILVQRVVCRRFLSSAQRQTNLNTVNYCRIYRPRFYLELAMNKFELIEAIRQLNYTASVDFLSQFNESDLSEYLSHLQEVERSELTAAIPSCVPFN